MHGVWKAEPYSGAGISYFLIITAQHAWLRRMDDKGGSFEDMYDIVPYTSSSTDYTDVYIYWMSMENPWDIYLYSGTLAVSSWKTSKYTDYTGALDPEEFIAWEQAN